MQFSKGNVWAFVVVTTRGGGVLLASRDLVPGRSWPSTQHRVAPAMGVPRLSLQTTGRIGGRQWILTSKDTACCRDCGPSRLSLWQAQAARSRSLQRVRHRSTCSLETTAMPSSPCRTTACRWAWVRLRGGLGVLVNGLEPQLRPVLCDFSLQECSARMWEGPWQEFNWFHRCFLNTQ